LKKIESSNKSEYVMSNMRIKTKHIFGCNHENRTILSTVIFERGLELPSIFCKDCIGVCNICLNKIKTKEYNELKLCENCYFRVIKITKN